MTQPSDPIEAGSDLQGAQRDVLELRKSLQAGISVDTRATSIDGIRFGFQSALDIPLPLGGFVVIETADAVRYLGQVTDRHIEERPGARVAIEVPDVAVGQARVSQAELGLLQRMIVGSGTLLGRLTDAGATLTPTSGSDVFDGADVSAASAELIAGYLGQSSSDAATLDIGWSPFGGPNVRISLKATGFNRHTFLCGQSGSGKTFSLGVVLERLLLETSLRMIVIDPNSDFVGLGGVRSRDEVNSSQAENLDEEAYSHIAARYRSKVESLRVLRPNDSSNPLRIRFSELTPHEQAAVLRLDPLAHRAEFAAYREIAEALAERDYSLHDIRQQASAVSNEASEQVRLRIDNLGVADWEVWAKNDDNGLADDLAEQHRGLVLDVGGLSNADEKSIVAMSLLGRLWRQRESRQPVLVVIDEAHNICPAEPNGELQALATDHVIRIAGEGRKFGIYLLLSTQRPQKIHPNVLSQCDNLVMMRMNSAEDVEQLASTFSFVPPSLFELAPTFKLGEALMAGKIASTPTLTRIEGRLSPEGGGDVSATWARSQS